MTVSQLGKQLEIGSSNITPLCKRLENSGLVTRTRSLKDQRVVHVEITPLALEIIEKIEAEIRESSPSFENDAEDCEIITKGLQTLYDRLKKLNENTQKHNK